MPWVELDDDVMGALGKEARPLEDASAVLRRLLGLASMEPPPREAAPLPAAEPKRAPLGSLVPIGDYEPAILRELAERGGAGPARDVTQAVGERLAGRLTERDHGTLASGVTRWESRVQVARMRLVDRGLLRRDSPRGTWELTEAGEKAAKSGLGEG
jgi:hypothetical protein